MPRRAMRLLHDPPGDKPADRTEPTTMNDFHDLYQREYQPMARLARLLTRRRVRKPTAADR